MLVLLQLGCGVAAGAEPATEPLDLWRVRFTKPVGFGLASQLGGSGRYGSLLALELGAGRRVGEHLEIGLASQVRAWGAEVGLRIEYAEAVWQASGPVLGAHIAFLATGIACSDDPECPPTRDTPNTAGRGVALHGQPGLRWSLRGDRQALTVALDTSVAALTGAETPYGGVYVGGLLGLRIGVDG